MMHHAATFSTLPPNQRSFGAPADPRRRHLEVVPAEQNHPSVRAPPRIDLAEWWKAPDRRLGHWLGQHLFIASRLEAASRLRAIASRLEAIDPKMVPNKYSGVFNAKKTSNLSQNVGSHNCRCCRTRSGMLNFTDR